MESLINGLNNKKEYFSKYQKRIYSYFILFFKFKLKKKKKKY